MKIASVDIGTNAVKSKIFKTTPTSIKYIDGIRSPIRLGAEVFKKGKLSEKKLKELTHTLKKYQKKFIKDGISQYEIVATSALRNTSNSEDARRYIENKIEKLQTEKIITILNNYNGFYLAHKHNIRTVNQTKN